jgi:hypothetical protein
MDEIDRIANRLQVGEIFVLDSEPDGALAEFFLEGFDEFDQGERVGSEVVLERLAFGDGLGIEFEDVDQQVADDDEDLSAVERVRDDVSFCGHVSSVDRVGQGRVDPMGRRRSTSNLLRGAGALGQRRRRDGRADLVDDAVFDHVGCDLDGIHDGPSR